MQTIYRSGRFLIDGSDGDYEGYTDGSLWNGWACPVFERSVADLIVADLTTSASHNESVSEPSVVYEQESDSYRVDEDGNDPVWFGRENIHINGREVGVYTLGTRYWTWEESQETATAGS